MKTFAIWGLFSLFTIIAIGQQMRYKKYRRLDSVFHAAAFYLSGVIGLLTHSFIPFIAGFVITGVASSVVAYRRRRRDSPSAEELASRLFDDTAFNKKARRQVTVLNHAFVDPDNAEVISEHGLSPADFTDVFQAMLNLGCPKSEAEVAMHAPDILRWYFTNVGRRGVFTPDQSVEFLLMIRRYAAREG
jgi:hypothetical protein